MIAMTGLILVRCDECGSSALINETDLRKLRGELEDFELTHENCDENCDDDE